MITIQDIRQARERIAPYVLHTPLLRVPALDDDLGCEVYLKLESTQITGSFKLRGALNAVLSLSEEDRRRGVIASSSGNHAQGLALAAQIAGIRAVIVMPYDAPPVKVQHVKDYGAEVVLVDILERERVAKELSERDGCVIVHAFDDPFVQAGQGTAGLEIMEDLPDADAVIVPVGGAGLLSGIATAVKETRPAARAFGVESVAVPRYTTVFRTGRLEDLDHLDPTIADGVRGTHVSRASYDSMKKYVDGLVQGTDDEVRDAVYLLTTKAHVLAEPCSCLPMAAVLSGKIPVRKTDKTVFVVSGGNFRPELMAQILGRA